MNFTEINDATGFANGEPFQSEADVWAYFTPEAQHSMFGDDAVVDPDALSEMAATVIENGWHMAATKSNLELALEYVEGNLAAWQDDNLPKHMKAQIGESIKELRFVMGVADDLLEAVKSYLRCPSVGSDGPGSSTIVVQEFNRKAAVEAVSKAEGGHNE